MKTPFISVVIPVRNDAAGIGTTLNSLVRQDYPGGRYEVIVVDNNSGDATPDEAGRFQTAFPGLVRLLFERDVQGSYAARNRGIAHAAGEIICFLDANMWVDSDYLSRIAGVFARGNVDYLGCRIETVPIENRLISRFHRLTGFPAAIYITRFRFAVTAALAVSMELLDSVGRFDERFISGGDREFGNRVSDAGRRLHYAGDIVAYHPAFTRIRQLRKKYFRVGRGIFQLYFYYPDRYGEYNFSPFSPGLYLSGNPAKMERTYAGWTAVPGSDRLCFFLLLCVKKISQVSGYLYEKWKT